ncbi:MAG: toll/interleukin-1 receptor domain-containing protein [Chloroflexi bacterium]|nr:MAG: toll/interleukin-1 receptor domain-containing protein [Chloroflexota bacterium]
MRIEKTVFISYRRTNTFHARAVHQALCSRGYDVFLDVESINSGAFEQVILAQIDARAHFVAILTPSALERCIDPNDMVRREIERAIDRQRNIVPLMFEGFNFRDSQQYLVDKLAVLPQYNGLNVPSDFFEEAMARLDERFLSKPLDTILHPVPPAQHAVVEQKIAQAMAVPAPTAQELKAEELFEKGVAAKELGDPEQAVEYFTQAVLLRSDFAEAYFRRGHANWIKANTMQAARDFEQAVALAHAEDPRAPLYRASLYALQKDTTRALAEVDEAARRSPTDPEPPRLRGNIHGMAGNFGESLRSFDEAIRLNPQDHVAYYGRGYTRMMQGDHANALTDFDTALRINPRFVVALIGRGNANGNRGDINQAVADFSEAIRLNPQLVPAYYQRGITLANLGRFAESIEDFNQVIRLNPQDPMAYNNRGAAREQSGDLDGAITDYQEALRIYPALELAMNNLRRAQAKKAGSGLLNWFRGKS